MEKKKFYIDEEGVIEVTPFFDKQVKLAYDNYNYFFMKMIVKILQISLKLAIVLLISEIFNYTFVNVIALIYTIISIYSMYETICNYKYIIMDIKNTLGYDNISFEVDLNFISNNIFKGLVNYGK